MLRFRQFIYTSSDNDARDLISEAGREGRLSITGDGLATTTMKIADKVIEIIAN